MWILINLVLVFETKHADDIIVIHAPSIYETQEECNNELIKAHKNLDGGIKLIILTNYSLPQHTEVLCGNAWLVRATLRKIKTNILVDEYCSSYLLV